MNVINVSKQLEQFAKFYDEISPAIDRQTSLNIGNLITHINELLSFAPSNKSDLSTCESIFIANYRSMELNTSIRELYDSFRKIKLADTSLTQSRQYMLQDSLTALLKTYDRIFNDLMSQHQKLTDQQYDQLITTSPPSNLENIILLNKLFRKYGKSYILYIKYMQTALIQDNAEIRSMVLILLERDKSDILKHSSREERVFLHATFGLVPIKNEFITMSELIKILGQTDINLTFATLAKKIGHPVIVLNRHKGVPIFTILSSSYTFPEGLCNITPQPLQSVDVKTDVKITDSKIDTLQPFIIYGAENNTQVLVVEKVGENKFRLLSDTKSNYTSYLAVRKFLENDFSRPYNYNRILETKFIPKLRNVDEFNQIKEEKVDMEPAIRVAVAFAKKCGSMTKVKILEFLETEDFSKLFQTGLDITSKYKTTVIYLLDWLENEFRNDIKRIIIDAITPDYLREIAGASLKSILDRPDNIYYILHKKELLLTAS